MTRSNPFRLLISLDEVPYSLLLCELPTRRSCTMCQRTIEPQECHVTAGFHRLCRYCVRALAITCEEEASKKQ